MTATGPQTPVPIAPGDWTPETAPDQVLRAKHGLIG